MISGRHTLKRYDTRPSLLAQFLHEDGEPLDLSTVSTLKFVMYDSAGAQIVYRDATITDSAAGRVRYDWQTADTQIAGRFRGEFEIVWVDSSPQTLPGGGEFIEILIGQDLNRS